MAADAAAIDPCSERALRILVVDDEKPMRDFLRQGLSEEGYRVVLAADADEAERALRLEPYDAIVLDVMLPGGDGFTLCRRWRDLGIETPILFLTARDEVRDRVRGLDVGGDDYLRKPFAFAELLARLRALLRRRGRDSAANEIRVGDLRLDVASRRVRRGGREIALTTREYQLLEYLARHAGRVIPRADLWDEVWGGDTPDSNVVDVYVRYLRNKLGRDPDVIRTVRGGGYVLESVGSGRPAG